MKPAYLPGDSVLMRRRLRGTLQVGTVIVLSEPGAPRAARPRRLAGWPASRLAGGSWVIKRVAAKPGDEVPPAVLDAVAGTSRVPPGKLVVLGDNTDHSADSRQWGFVSAGDVLGVVVRTLSRLELPVRS
jgi:signal peptidase I